MAWCQGPVAEPDEEFIGDLVASVGIPCSELVGCIVLYRTVAECVAMPTRRD